ncbi:MAG: polyphosphate kinase 1 [Burkholderiaceae bacterium]|nr:MAG: polyphosphate kinase 1 [Burkholderiaceae bacterium]
MQHPSPLISPPPSEVEQTLLNRELGILAFNARVLAQAEDPTVPLLERLRYLCISSSNMDELFEIRVSGLHEQMRGSPTYRSPDGLLSAQILAQVSERAHGLVARQYQVLNEMILPALENEGVYLHQTDEWNAQQAAWAREYFDEQILPVLTPIGLDPVQPFPKIYNKSLNFIVTLQGEDAFQRDSGIAIVQAPRILPRLIPVPPEISGYPHGFMMLTSIMQGFVSALFPGMEVQGCYQFRVTRNSDLFVDEEEVTNLRLALQGELSQRHFGSAVRLEISEHCPAPITQLLLREFGLQPVDCYRVDGPVNLIRLMPLADKVDRADLKFPPFTPGIPNALQREENVFDAIRAQDILLHHPYQSFTPVLEFLQTAARDPDVVAIKQTIYRTGNESELMDTLINAARNGKEVTVVVELMARFDEEININWAAQLEEVGAHVVYGIVGHKTHAKMLLVLRREKGKLKRYVHLGTGNYHPRTARLYTDFGLLTCNPEITQDVHEVFQQLTGLGKANRQHHLWQSPFTMHKKILGAIRHEIDHAHQGKPARVIAKMNALLETEVIEMLYAASQAGVKIDLIVRGVCALRPGVPGLSDNITVRSIVGRFLEHSRVFYFYNGGQENVYLSSADWMNRNLLNRVEIAFPLLNQKLKQRVIDEGLLVHLQDTQLSWVMDADGNYTRLRDSAGNTSCSQELLLYQLAT